MTGVMGHDKFPSQWRARSEEVGLWVDARVLVRGREVFHLKLMYDKTITVRGRFDYGSLLCEV